MGSAATDLAATVSADTADLAAAILPRNFGGHGWYGGHRGYGWGWRGFYPAVGFYADPYYDDYAYYDDDPYDDDVDYYYYRRSYRRY